MTEQEYKTKLDELDEKIDIIWKQSFERKDGLEWYRNHPFLKEYIELNREYKTIKTPIMHSQNSLDKECLMGFKEFEEGCKNGPLFSNYDGYGCYATKDEISDIEIVPSDIISGIYRKDFDYICWYNK